MWVNWNKFYKLGYVLLLVRGGARGVPGGPLPPKNFVWPPQWPPQNFSGLFLKVLHRPLTAPLVAKLAPPVAPPNEKVWLHPCFSCCKSLYFIFFWPSRHHTFYAKRITYSVLCRSFKWRVKFDDVPSFSDITERQNLHSAECLFSFLFIEYFR